MCCINVFICNASPQLYVSGSMRIHRANKRITVHARRQFYNRPRYDFVRVSGSAGEMWAARVLGICRVYMGLQDRVVKAGWKPLMVVQWLARDEDANIHGMQAFRHLAGADVINPKAVDGLLKLIELPSNDPDPLLLAIPYGKSSVVNDGIECIV